MKKPPRNGDLARIHMLKAQLKLTREQYEAVLWTIARVESSAKMDQHQRRQLIDHLESRLPEGSKPGWHKGRPHSLTSTRKSDLRKIEALLTDAGRPWAYADALLKQMTGGSVQRLDFASGDQLVAIITALEKDALKRLSAALEAELGEKWVSITRVSFKLLFDPGYRRDITRHAQAMSLVLRWYLGTLKHAPYCEWPRHG